MNSLARCALGALPALMLVLAPLIVNRDEPRVAGLPLLLAWVVFWVLVTPVFLYGAERLRQRR